jgi:hypothetical protein
MKTFFFLLLFLSGSAFSQALPATSTGSVHPQTTSGSTYTYGGAKATSSNASSLGFGPAANGSISTTSAVRLPSPSGSGSVPITVNGSISKAAAAAAIGRFALKATGVIGVLQVGVGLYDLAKELGYNVDNSSGSLVVNKPDSLICSVAPCYEYSITNQASGRTSPYFRSLGEVCSWYAANFGFSAAVMTSCVMYKSVNMVTAVPYAKSSYGAGDLAVARSIAPLPPASVVVPVKELTDSIAAKPTWPPESAIARAVRDAVKSGEEVVVDPVSVTGPATSPGTRTVTNTGTSTTTSQVTNNYNYAGNTVTVSTVTNSSTVNNTSGASEGQSTTTTSPEAEPTPEVDSASDTALSGKPTLYERKYPDGFIGVWNTKKAEILASPLLQLTSNLQPAIGSPSGYPVWLVPVVIGHWNFGSYDVSPAGYVWDFLKVCTILGALFLSRALIFGG